MRPADRVTGDEFKCRRCSATDLQRCGRLVRLAGASGDVMHNVGRHRCGDLLIVASCPSSSRCRRHHLNPSPGGGRRLGTGRPRARCRRSLRSTRSFIAATPLSLNSTISAFIRMGSRSVCGSSRVLTRGWSCGHRCSPRVDWIRFLGGHGSVFASPTAVPPAARQPSTVAISTSQRTTEAFRLSPSSQCPVAAVACTAGTSACGCSHFLPRVLSRSMWRSRPLMLASQRSCSMEGSCALRPSGRGSSGVDGRPARHHAARPLGGRVAHTDPTGANRSPRVPSWTEDRRLLTGCLRAVFPHVYSWSLVIWDSMRSPWLNLRRPLRVLMDER